MKKLVCEKFCSFYKPGNTEETRCGSFDFLARNLTYGELKWIAERASEKFDLSADDLIRSMVCEKSCEFFASSDCDFRLGHDSPPCGGYSIVEGLLRDASPNAGH